MTKIKIKHDARGVPANTYHRDGTVSFWSVYQNVWERLPASCIDNYELAAMPAAERERVARRSRSR